MCLSPHVCKNGYALAKLESPGWFAFQIIHMIYNLWIETPSFLEEKIQTI